MTQRWLFTLVVFLTVANFLVWGLLGMERAYTNKVYPGVWVQAQSLAGMSREQVIDRLKPINQALLLKKVTLVLNDKEFQPTLKELGYSVNVEAMADAAVGLGRGMTVRQAVVSLVNYHQNRDIPIVYTIDQGVFDSYLNEVGKGISKEPKNMTITYQDGTLVIQPAEEGIGLDKEILRQAIQKQVRPGEESPRIVLEYSKVKPVIADQSQLTEAKDRLTKLLAKSLTLQAEEVNYELTPTKIFSLVYFDIQDAKLTVGIDDNKLKNTVADFAKKVDIKPVNKQISAINDGILQEGQDGRELDIPDTTKRLAERLNAADYESPLILSTKKVDRKTITISPEFQTGRVAGRYIEIDLSAQRAHFIEGNEYHRTAIISTGKWDTPTPIGEFTIFNHIPTAWSKRFGLYMPFWMGLKQVGGSYDGYGLHGLPYWPNGRKEGESHLGRPVSHGCIRFGADDVTYLYEWAPNDTPVFIHE